MKAAVQTLWENSPDSIEALRYLKEQRGLIDDVIREFNFGYCPANAHPELAGRIIMPLYDAYGNLIAITSRHTTAPKQFQHWHESFDKGAYLYGINAAKAYIYKTNKAIVVEGQFDTTCLHSYGFKQTVGVLGSAFNIMHVTLLSRMCSEIFIVLDPDDSGESGVERAMLAAKEYRLGIYEIRCIPVQMPTETDPDTFVIKNGPDAFVNLLRKSKEKLLNGH